MRVKSTNSMATERDSFLPHMNTAGASTRAMASQRRAKRLLTLFLTLAVFVAAIGLLLLFLAYNKKIVGSLGVFGAIAVLIAMKIILQHINDSALGSMRSLHKRERDATRGAVGEEVVGAILEAFCETRHLVLHDVKSPFGNLDHVVLTQSGNVFSIETKAHGGRATLEDGKLLVNDRPTEKDFIKQSLANTYWLKGELDRITGQDTWVNPIIVFANAFVPKPYSIKNVCIINKRFLAETLSRLNRKAAAVNLWAHLDEITDFLSK
jgi:hypothetical protein